MKQIKILVSMAIIAIVSISCSSSAKDKDGALSKWLRENSTQIVSLDMNEQDDDLLALSEIVGAAEVVCLGESRHDIHEQFKLKNRFIKYLVEKMGFTRFVLEASLPYANQINDFLLSGEGDIDAILANMPGWFLWDTEEITELVNWMRTHNSKAETESKVQFHGMDIVAPNNALEQIFAYMERVDPSSCKVVVEKNYGREIIDDNYWFNTWQRYADLSNEQKEIYTLNFNNLYKHLLLNESTYISSSSMEEYNWMLRLAYSAKEANRMFSAVDRMDIGLIRDSAMAQNVLWIQENMEEDERMIVWAHNVHITKGEFTMTGEEGAIKGMGNLMYQELGEDMISIGASFNQGAFQDWNRTFPPADSNTIDAVLANLFIDYLILDLKGASEDEEVMNWLNTKNNMRGQEFEMTCVPAESYDAIYFINDISRVITNPVSLEKLRN